MRGFVTHDAPGARHAGATSPVGPCRAARNQPEATAWSQAHALPIFSLTAGSSSGGRAPGPVPTQLSDKPVPKAPSRSSAFLSVSAICAVTPIFLLPPGLPVRGPESLGW